MEQTLGARLRSQRERQRVALVTIAEETKINAALLEGLERDDISRWPGGLFRRAYVRTYAQKIGLDPEQVLRDFLAVHPDPVESASPVEAIAQNADAKRPRTRIGLMLAGLAQRRLQRPDVPHRTTTADMFAIEEQAPVEGRETPVAENPEPAAESAPLLAPPEAAAPAPRLVMIPSPETALEPRRDLRTVERSVAAAARLCTRIACVRDDQDLGSVLEDAVHILDARGVILWIWDPDRDALFPGLAHGYPAELLGRLPEVDRLADNAIAAAFCCGEKQVVRGSSEATGAFVSPLLTPDGCVGALALEFANGGEQHELVQALATILTAQLSTLFSTPPTASIEDEWAQQDRSLVAS
jgi:helix-turn-helix protein